MQKFRYSKTMREQSHFCTPSAQTKQHTKKYTDEIITYNWIYRRESVAKFWTRHAARLRKKAS